METTSEDQKAILQLVEEGVEASAAKLAAISRTDWQIRTTSVRVYAKPEDYAEFVQPSQDFLGAHCQAPGKMFLTFMSARSAVLLTQSFLSGSRRGLQATARMQEVAVAELSNIVINAVAGSLADRCGMSFVISAPKTVRGSRADIIKAAFGEFHPIGNIFSAYIHLASNELAADCTLMLMLDDLIVHCVLNALGR